MDHSGHTILMPLRFVSILQVKVSVKNQKKIIIQDLGDSLNDEILDELVDIVSTGSSPIDQLWLGVLSSNVELVRDNLCRIPDNYQSPNPLGRGLS